MFPSLFVLDRDIIDLIQISLYIPSNYDLFSSKVSLSLFFFFVIFLFEYCCTLSFKSFFFFLNRCIELSSSNFHHKICF